MTPTTPLNSVDLPAPFGPTTAISAPASTAPSEVMHRRMAVVAERQIAECSCAVIASPKHREPDQRDQPPADTPSRSSTDMRRIDGCTVAGG